MQIFTVFKIREKKLHESDFLHLVKLLRPLPESFNGLNVSSSAARGQYSSTYSTVPFAWTLLGFPIFYNSFDSRSSLQMLHPLH